MLQVKEISLDTITLRDDFLRLEFSGEKYQELVNSVRQLGVLSPLVALDTSDGLILVSGYRRFQAAKDVALPTVPCICLKAGIDDAEILRLHENLYREDITPLQEAVSFLRLERTYHFTREKIAKLIGKSKAYITQRIQILDWADDLQQALSSNSINYSIARELSVITDQTERTRLLNICIQSGATVRTVLSWVQEWRANKPISEDPDQLTFDALDDIHKKHNKTLCYLCGHEHPLVSLTNILICKDCLGGINEPPPAPDPTPIQDPQATPPL